MASQGGTGLTAMISGKSVHKQFVIRQAKSDYVKRVCSAKSTIDNGLPTTFRRRLQREGRLAKEAPPPSRPMSSTTRRQRELQQQLTTTQFLEADQLDLEGGDILETHKGSFTESRPFTPRTNNDRSRRSAGVVAAQSRLVASGVFVRPPPRPGSAKKAAATGSGEASRRRRFDGTFDVHDGGLAGREVEAAVQQRQDQRLSQEPPRSSRTADWVLDGGSGGGGRGGGSGYDTLFSKIDEAYYPFAEGIVKEISNSGVTSNRMIRIIMQKHVDQNRGRLKARQMEQVCQLIGEYLGIDDETEADEPNTEELLATAAAAAAPPQKPRQRPPQLSPPSTPSQPPPPPLLLRKQPAPLPPPEPPVAAPRAVGARPFSADPQDEDPTTTLTLTDVSQMDATATAAAATPSRFNDDEDEYDGEQFDNDDDYDNRSATPLEDFQEALRTQLRVAPAAEEAAAAAHSNGGGRDETGSMSEFGTTLRPGQFEAMQTMVGSPSRGKTVRFS